MTIFVYHGFHYENPSHIDTNTFCSVATSNYNGVECPNYCPTTCGPDQFMCEPDYDSNGCPMKPVCVPMDPCGDSSSQCPKTNDYQGCPVQPGKTFKNLSLISVMSSLVFWSLIKKSMNSECGQDEILCGNDVSHMSMRQGQECAPVGWCMPAKSEFYTWFWFFTSCFSGMVF